MPTTNDDAVNDGSAVTIIDPPYDEAAIDGFDPALAFDPETMPTKIAMVGFTASRDLAPWDDPEWKIYGCNNLHVYIDDSKFAGMFDLHDAADIRLDEQHVDWLTKTKVPVYVWRVQDDWPSSVAYPRDEILDGFAHFRGSRYFTNSISWMVAWGMAQLQPAMLAGQEVTLGIFGVDMAQGSEYAAQRPSCEYWVGLAEAAGINVIIPDSSDLLKAASLYGAEDDSQLRAKLTARQHELVVRFNEVEEELAKVNNYLSELRAMQHQILGAQESNNYILGVWMQPGGDPRKGGDPAAPVSSDGSGDVDILAKVRETITGGVHA